MNQNVIASYALISQLKKMGVTTAVVSPGSRNTPLAYSANELLETIVLIDERDAGFCALGIAESTNIPTIVITTSGSAPTHLFPSLAEASGSNIPIIVISADRPHEIRGRGAPQTIDQIELFTSHVRFFSDAPLPSNDIDTKFWIALASDIYNASLGNSGQSTSSGPVHLNIGFDENLVPDGDEIAFVDDYFNNIVSSSQAKSFGFLSNDSGSSRTNTDQGFEFSQEIQDLFQASKNILFTFGRNGLKTEERSNILNSLSQFPVLCDVTSQLRFSDDVITTYDTIVRGKNKHLLKPDLIIQIGDCLTSKKFNEFNSGIETIALKTQNDGRNPYGNITHTIICPDISVCIEKLVANKSHADSDFANIWKTSDEKANKSLNALLEENPTSEPSLFSQLGRIFEKQDYKLDVLLGSSMPVRYAEWFWPVINSENRVFSHRGTNGIDGFISSLFGIAMGSENKAIGVCGDVTFTHDLGFLPHCVNLSKQYGKAITIFVIDNDGGAIFTHLNQKKSKTLSESYEKLIATPPKINIEKISVACGASYVELELDNAKAEYDSLVADNGVGTKIVRIRVDHESGLDFMNQLNSVTE